jgi:oligoendopeptidase F
MAKRLIRNYLHKDLEITTFQDIKPYYDELLKRELNSPDQVWQWLLDRSELESVISEDMGWRYIKMNCQTDDKKLAEHFNTFVSEIDPDIALAANKLDKKFMDEQVQKHIDKARLFTVIRETKKELDLFREENVPLEAELQKMEQDFGQIASKMTVHYQNKELTLQEASNFLKDTNRNVREEVYHLINNRRLADTDTLNNLLSKQIKLRHQIALNAGFSNFRDYKFKSMGRFDYNVVDCYNFHSAVAHDVVPMNEDLFKIRKSKLKVDTLRPWDLDVDEELKAPLKPFDTVSDLIRKTVYCFRDLDLEFGIYLNEMDKMGYLNLDSRKHKAPGGFNYPLHESNVPFIFMNATGNLDDMVTMLHEGGHAIHAYLTAHLDLVHFKEIPSEIAELASMSMELITMDYWHHFFDNEADLKRAKRTHLQNILSVLPWVAKIDKFQHFLYENPNHTHEERNKAWAEINKEFCGETVDFTGLEKYQQNIWQRQLHIFEVPFYYIEYGIAQLGAIAIWKNFKQDKKQALEQYKNALKMGYTSPIPEVYKAAGIKFDFSDAYIQELMDFVKAELVLL